MQQAAVFGNSFPNPLSAAISPDGVIAAGGLFRGQIPAQLLLEAYSKAIFPWYTPGQTPLWFCPDPRAGLDPMTFKVSKSFSKVLRNKEYEVRVDSKFAEVLSACALIERKQGTGTWLSAELRKAVLELHDANWAHSVEVYEEGVLVGGLYGIKIGQMFFGESMFSAVPDASKIALAYLCLFAKELGISFIDCQMKTPHLEKMGAQEYTRKYFLSRAYNLMTMPTEKFELDFQSARLQIGQRIASLI